MRRVLSLATAGLLSISAAATAQTGISVGVGGGIVGFTESSLSDGKSGAVGMVAVTRSLVPLIGIGAEVDYLRRSGWQTVMGAGFVKLSLPIFPLSIKLGVAVGQGETDGSCLGSCPAILGSISGVGGQLGATYDITLPAIPIAFTIFGNAFLVHALRNFQMVDAGLALTWK
jgi:hypothetical protein